MSSGTSSPAISSSVGARSIVETTSERSVARLSTRGPRAAMGTRTSKSYGCRLSCGIPNWPKWKPWSDSRNTNVLSYKFQTMSAAVVNHKFSSNSYQQSLLVQPGHEFVDQVVH